VWPGTGLIGLSLLAALLVGCQSPEARRQPGGGPGADVGNRGAVVQMHEGSQPYYETPGRIGDIGGGDLGPAHQADRLSRRARQ
jgi:hypothetical protein